MNNISVKTQMYYLCEKEGGGIAERIKYFSLYVT